MGFVCYRTEQSKNEIVKISLDLKQPENIKKGKLHFVFQFVKSYTKRYESRFEFRSSSHQNVTEIENRRAGVTVTVVTKLGSMDGIFSSFMQNSWYKSNGKDCIPLEKIDLRGFVMECDVPSTKLPFLIKCLPLL